MSYNLVNPTTGDLTRVAGRGRAEYGASTIRKGTVNFENISTPQWATASVVFDTPMPDANYEVIINTDDGYIIDGMTSPLTISNKTINGFTVKIYVHVLTSFRVSYTAFKLYSDIEYSNIVNSMPSDASASNKLVTESDTNSTTLTSTDSLASWAGNAKGVMTAFIGTSSKPSDIGAPLSSWGETMIWCIGHDIRKTLFAIDYSVAQHVIYTREYFNGSFITDWTVIKDGNLTSTVTSGSTAPITSGGVYDAFGFKEATVTDKEFDIDTGYAGTSVYEIIATQYNAVNTQPGHWIVNFVGLWGNSCQITSDSDGANKCTFTSIGNTLHGVLTNNCQKLLYRKLI